VLPLVRPLRLEALEGGLLGDLGGAGRRHDVLRFDMRGTVSVGRGRPRCLVVVTAV
jgi:hypothetical protein